MDDDVDALVLAASSSLGLRNAGKLGDGRTAVGATVGARAGKENVASPSTVSTIANGKVGTASRWRSKALAALSQLASLQQRATAAELKACELQLAVDQAALTAQALDAENRSVRAMLADVQDERDRLMLEVKLRCIKSADKPDSAGNTLNQTTSLVVDCSGTLDGIPVPCEGDHRHRASVSDLTAQLDALRVVHEETKLENESLALGQQGLKERVTALQELVAKLQDANDFFGSLRAEDVLAQEEEVDAIYGTQP